MSSKLKILTERYLNVLPEAELRREKLAYKTLKVGQRTNERINRILDLLKEVHQSYYLGFFESTAILCGVLLEQCLTALLEEEIELLQQRHDQLEADWNQSAALAKNMQAFVDEVEAENKKVLAQMKDKRRGGGKRNPQTIIPENQRATGRTI